LIKNKILFIEDDTESALSLQEFLTERGFDTEIFTTITDAIFRIKFNNYNLILLDLNLPDYEGYEVLKFLNSENFNIPVIVISGYSDTQTKIKAFKFGASDYLVKPVDPMELEARMWVHLGKNSSIKNFSPSCVFKIDKNTIYYKDNLLKLTRTEFRILKTIIENPNQIIYREDLYRVLSPKSNQRTLDGHIKNIRKKIKEIYPEDEDVITTEYGLGYRLNI
jgi:DNA-binding response OmpR family regulator